MNKRIRDLSGKTQEFAAACYDMNSIEELEEALEEGPDAGDMKEWGITEEESTAAIEAALNELKDEKQG